MNYYHGKLCYLILCCMAIYSELLCVYALLHILFPLPRCYHLPRDFRPPLLQPCCKYLTSHSLICLFSPAEPFPFLVPVSWGAVRPLNDGLSRAAARAVPCGAAALRVTSRQRVMPAWAKGDLLRDTAKDKGPSAASSYPAGTSKQGRCHSTLPGWH